LQLGLRANDVNAYNLSMSFVPEAMAPDDFEANNDVADAKYIHTWGFSGGLLFTEPRITIDATIHEAGDVDYYIVRGARLSNSEAEILFGPFVSVYANTAPINLHVYQLKDGALVDRPELRVRSACGSAARRLLPRQG
jgi:hypothetical protein